MKLKFKLKFKDLVLVKKPSKFNPIACGSPSLCGWPTKENALDDACGVPSAWPPGCGTVTCGVPSVPGCGAVTCGTPSNPGCGTVTCGTPSAWPPECEGPSCGTPSVPDCGPTTCGTPSAWPPDCGPTTCGTPSEVPPDCPPASCGNPSAWPPDCGETTCGTPSEPGCGEVTCGTPSEIEQDEGPGWVQMSSATVVFTDKEFTDIEASLTLREVVKQFSTGITTKADLLRRKKALADMQEALDKAALRIRK